MDSVVCRPESDPDVHKQNPFLASLMRMTRKRKQDAKEVVRGAIEYGHKDISEHAAQAFACVNADEDECTDNTHTDTKIRTARTTSAKP